MSQCPTCSKEVRSTDNPSRPFCSERCKLIDLGKWVTEEYCVPGKMASEESTDEDKDSAESELK